MNESQQIVETLPVLQRMALAYAPPRARAPTLALLALDARLAGIVRSASEPMLAQLRLAWWRDRFALDAAQWPAGEPLLGALRGWNDTRGALSGLVDGWEQMTAEPPLSREPVALLAKARGSALAALASLVGAPQCREAAARAGQDWALADIAANLRDAGERGAALSLLAERDFSAISLPRALRPLAVLRGLATHAARQGKALDGLGPSTALIAIRIGLLGR